MIRKIFRGIFGFPVWLIKKIRDWIVGGFRNLHLSMRRKITADYLTIYTISALLSIVFIPIIFMFFEIDDHSDDVSNVLNSYFTSYVKEEYDFEELEVKVNQVYLREEVSLLVEVTENETSQLIETGDFKTVGPMGNVMDFFNKAFNEGLVGKRIIRYDLPNADETRTLNFDVRGYYPLTLYMPEMITLGIIMLVFYSVGFVFMSMIGGARVKNILSPIYYMTKTAEQVSVSNLDLRLDVESTKYELKDLAITLNDMLDRLNRDYGKQKRFVSDVSHELRTPISIINGYASMLERWGKKDEEILDESIDAIKGEAVNMQVLVENLLTLVRSDNQTLKYEPNTFDIGQMVCSIVKEFNMVNTKEQYITCDAKEGIRVFLDEAKIKQTMRIFIDNAVKYTPEKGGIQVKCYEVGEEVYLHVKDSGIGISKEDLPHLFERFYRSDESRTRQTGGHGLGLSIGKVIVIGHSGRIKVKSKVGKGSEFIITLPKTMMINDVEIEEL